MEAIILKLMNELVAFFKKKSQKNDSPDIDRNLLEIIKTLSTGKVSSIFDVGACHGRYSLASSHFFLQADIHCFEPFPEAFDVLKKNLKGDRFHLNNVAVSNKIGNEKFYVNNLHETNSLLPSAHTNSIIDKLIKSKSEIIVGVTTIQDYCDSEKINCIDILKIDAQGNTINVLEGCLDLLVQGRIKFIQCEVEFLEIYQNQKLFHHIATYLEQYNYHLFSLYNLHFDVNDRLSWADALFYIPQQ
ncbi:MAG: methyltransferase FkbM family [Sphingobacteriales bacterium]|nr:methyltransferase FkbM family [Sphingobacteriales bacterium]